MRRVSNVPLELRRTKTPPTQEPEPIMSKPKLNESNLSHLIQDRAPKMKERDRLDKEIKLLNSQIAESLNEAGVTTHQLMTGPLAGTVVQMIKPSDRQVIVPERLLSLGVSPQVIADATKTTPVAAYPRVDAPKGTDAAKGVWGDNETAAEPSFDTTPH